jgi:L-cysteine:1D-myo-inositol 2-amino-2-deoxy-alpha-D-glucopyranoside ligase
MKSWPSVDVPVQPFTFPALNLIGTKGHLIDADTFTSYVCGITPYDATHLGHAATYLTFDLIHRYELASGKELNFIENITDIDDPLFERANRDNQDWAELGTSQIELFRRDMAALRIVPPQTYLAVTETINLVLEALETLENSAKIYKVENDYYFDIAPYISELTMSEEESLKIFAERGGDPERIGKKNSLDPLVWRGNIPGEPGWESKFGFGRPGWHIECSVIAIKGASSSNHLHTINMQGGGSDLIFPHHFMSAAIATAINGKDFADIYVHAGMIGLDGEKMSKSKGNLVFVHKLLDQGWDPMTIRLALMDGNLFTDRMWSNDDLSEAEKKKVALRSALSLIEVADPKPVIENMISALSNNLDTKTAIEELINWSEASVKNPGNESPGIMSRFIDAALGLAL